MIRRVTAVHHVLTWICLVLLSALTLGLSFVPLGAFQPPTALLIAALKCAFIVLVFMHLLEQRSSDAFVLLFCLFMVALLVVLSATDVATRAGVPLPSRHDPAVVAPPRSDGGDAHAGGNGLRRGETR